MAAIAKRVKIRFLLHLQSGDDKRACKWPRHRDYLLLRFIASRSLELNCTKHQQDTEFLLSLLMPLYFHHFFFVWHLLIWFICDLKNISQRSICNSINSEIANWVRIGRTLNCCLFFFLSFFLALAPCYILRKVLRFNEQMEWNCL